MRSTLVRLAALAALISLPAACNGPAGGSDALAAGQLGGARGRSVPVTRIEPAPDTTFAGTIARLSEPGGYFNSDNLVSNETAYLHAMGPLRTLGTRGGAYVGVGPDQSFSYIAETRPEVAFIIDLRRDNLLHHLLYKSLFGLARNRAEYLLLLTGREVPRDVARLDGRSLEQLVALADSLPFAPAVHTRTQERVAEAARATGVPLTAEDLTKIAAIHNAFAIDGLSLTFTSHARAPRPYYPTLRRLLLETDREGRQANYLVDEDRFRFLKRLQREDRVIPVVGDLAGPHALAAIGEEVRRRGLVVSTFYTSNVEFYLMRGGTFHQFAQTTAALPRDARSALVRSCFGYACGVTVDERNAGHFSVQLVQPLDSFAAVHARGDYVSYNDVVTRGILTPR